MEAIFRDNLGAFAVDKIKHMFYYGGKWTVEFLDGSEEEYEAELLEVSL